MSWTNIHIGGNEVTQRLYDEIGILEFKLKQAMTRIDRLQDELENIPKAILEYGHVDITWDKKEMKLILATTKDPDHE